MPFMFLTLAVVGVIAFTAFFSTSPRVANPRSVLAFNVATIVLSIPVAIGVGWWIYADASAVKAGERGMAAYLGIMTGGNAALFVVAVGGLIRNFFVFPRSKRLPPPAAANS